MENANRLMTMNEAAEFMRVTVQCIKNYIKDKKLTPFYGPAGRGPGKPLRLSALQVQNFFAQSTANQSVTDGSANEPEPAQE